MSDMPTNGGFGNRALHAIPPWAMGVIGTSLGIAFAFFIAVKLGGLDGAVQKIANAYATRIEAGVSAPVQRLEAMANKFENIDKRLAEVELDVINLDQRVSQIETSHEK